MKRPFALLAAFLLAGSLGSVSLPASAAPDTPKPAPAPDLSGLHDFDFVFGDWKVQHRTLKKDRQGWVEFEGTSTTRPVMGGWGNLEDNVLAPPSGSYRAAALRSYDGATGLWSIWWLDGRSPQGPLDPPVRGRFENGVGLFYSDDLVDGRPVRTRYTWTHSSLTSARWEQASSLDGGKTWETNWTMEFRRVP